MSFVSRTCDLLARPIKFWRQLSVRIVIAGPSAHTPIMTKTAATFADAFRILEEATNEQPRPELGFLVSQEVGILAATLVQEAAASLTQVSRFDAERSVDVANRLANEIDKKIQENPTLVLGGIALVAFAIGVTVSASVNQRGRA